jgi:SIR2-like domain
MSETATLAKLVAHRKMALFVGAGVSMNIGMPSWSKLLEHLSAELGFDPRVFGTLGDAYLLAEYYKLEKGSLGPLRSWMDREWDKATTEIKDSEIHEIIVRLNFPVVYTTNYDRWLERAYEAFGLSFGKISSIADLPAHANSERQIVKFHGDFDHEASIVLTESSYFERMSFESHLDYKLKSDMMRYGLLFIGYSVSDINIRYLIYKIDQLWKDSGYAKSRPSSYVFLTRPNPVLERVLESRGINTITSEYDDPAEGLLAFLLSLVTA